MPYQVPVEGREEKAAGAVRVEVHGALVPLALLWVDATRAHRRAHLGSMSWDQCYDPRLSQRRVQRERVQVVACVYGVAGL